MADVRFLTAGESHGKALIVILEGIPANIDISYDAIEEELERRRLGYGRGTRMKIEKDELEVLSGIRNRKTTGSPISLLIKNAEWSHWIDIMSPYPATAVQQEPILFPRPGHADLAGAQKYHQSDIRNISERASARETAARVAAGAICKQFLQHFAIEITSHIISIGSIGCDSKIIPFDTIKKIDRFSTLRVVDKKLKIRMEKLIDAAAAKGDTLGGILEVIIKNVPPGLGSYAQWDLRLDAALAGSMISIPAMKGVEIGIGFKAAHLSGSCVQDAIYYDNKKGFYRKTNNAGGIEGGISNGEDIRIKACIKPIPTLKKPLDSVNISSKEKGKASIQRSDVCAVNPATVIAENVCAITIAQFFLRKFGGDSYQEVEHNYHGYMKLLHQSG